VPGRTTGEFAFLQQHNAGFTFLTKVIGERTTHHAAADDHYLCLRLHHRNASITG